MTKLEQAAEQAEILSREQVERYYGSNLDPSFQTDVDDLCESHERMRAELDAARKHVADYLRLTDPTPLTEQVLRDAGFVEHGAEGLHPFFSRGGLVRWCHGTFSDGLEPYHPQPTSLGELNQLLRRVNGGAE